MRGGWRMVTEPRRRSVLMPPLKTHREFSFEAYESSETFGGRFRLNLVEEGTELKGTSNLNNNEQ